MLVALVSHEGVKRPPIRAAKFFKSLACRWQLTLRGEYYAPMGRRKCDCAVLPGGYRLNRAH